LKRKNDSGAGQFNSVQADKLLNKLRQIYSNRIQMWQNRRMKRIRIKEKNLPYVFLTGFAIILVIVSLLNSNVVTVQALPEKIVRIYVINQGSNTVSVINNVLHKVVATVPVGKNPIQMNGHRIESYHSDVLLTTCID
jgi:YVTN family beta-propeller protein